MDIEKSSMPSGKQKDRQKMEVLNKYLNYSLMKLNDGYVQERYKMFLKKRDKDKKKEENVYERLQKNAKEVVVDRLENLSKILKQTQSKKSHNLNKS